MNEDEASIIEEVKDHAAYWRSDRAKRATVERHLKKPSESHPDRKGIPDVEAKIDSLIKQRELISIKTRSGEYLKVKSNLRPVDLIFPEGLKLKQQGKCPTCAKTVKEEDLRDEISKKEFRISGMCQECQDHVFHSKVED